MKQKIPEQLRFSRTRTALGELKRRQVEEIYHIHIEVI